MSTEIAVAIITSVASIVVALIAASKEARPKPKAGNAAAPRPVLMFIATAALLLAISAFILVLYLRPRELRIGHATASVVICAGTVTSREVGPCLQTKIRQRLEDTLRSEHLVPMDVPKDGVIVAGWYTPEDAVSQIANLDYINVVLEPSSEKQLKLQVSVREGAAGAGIRIRLHAIYTMAD